MPLSCGLRAT